MTPTIKQQLLQELNLIPEDKLADVYNFLHHFRLGLEKSANSAVSEQILSFAGCWSDMPVSTFDDFLQDITERRQHAFLGRRNDESIID